MMDRTEQKNTPTDTTTQPRCIATDHPAMNTLLAPFMTGPQEAACQPAVSPERGR